MEQTQTRVTLSQQCSEFAARSRDKPRRARCATTRRAFCGGLSAIWMFDELWSRREFKSADGI